VSSFQKFTSQGAGGGFRVQPSVDGNCAAGNYRKLTRSSRLLCSGYEATECVLPQVWSHLQVENQRRKNAHFQHQESSCARFRGSSSWR